MNLEEIMISKIKVGDRVREELGDIEKLARSIEDIGLVQPIAVRKREDGGYDLVAGQRRLQACRELGREKIEAAIIEGETNGD